jgi:8-amino-7-oxononanoate synthase
MNSLLDAVAEDLEILKDQNLYRKLKALQLTSPVRGEWEGKAITLFCSNDYLGFSFNSELKEVIKNTIDDEGLGSGASRLISGSRVSHNLFEKAVAEFLNKESALLFSSGYLANLGVITSLFDKEDCILMDKLSHASLIDAVKLSGARVRVYPHGNLKRLEELLTHESSARRLAIVTDSVFSMDGDLAKLSEIIDLKKKYKALLILDEAHGFGVFGDKGQGLSAADNHLDDVDIYIGTLSKAMGLQGGFVAGSKTIIRNCVNRARSFIYDTALMPAVLQGALKALEMIEEGTLRKQLWENVKKVRSLVSQKFDLVTEDISPIIPLLVGDENKALELSAELLEAGLFIPAVRYPTVAKGKARLRLTVSAAHTDEDLAKLESVFGSLK